MSDTTNPPATERRFALARPKVPPFARYKGTSAWRKDRRRVKAYNLFRAAQRQAEHASATAGH